MEDVQIAYDGKDITKDVLAQLRERDGQEVWPRLGQGVGTDLDKLSAKDPATGRVEGTGEIDLLRLGLDIIPGEHRLTFSVPYGGGKLQYNLYID